MISNSFIRQAYIYERVLNSLIKKKCSIIEDIRECSNPISNDDRNILKRINLVKDSVIEEISLLSEIIDNLSELLEELHFLLNSVPIEPIETERHLLEINQYLEKHHLTE